MIFLVSLGSIFDSMIQLGNQTSLRIFQKTLSATSELEWNQLYLHHREAVLSSMSPVCNSMHYDLDNATCSRIKSYQYVLKNNPNFTTSLTALDNDGNPIQINCKLQKNDLIISTNSQSKQSILDFFWSLTIGLVIALVSY